jgi:hypothetical protein
MTKGTQGMQYEYKMVQVPPTIVLKKDTGQGEAAQYLQAVVNQEAVQGWDFYRVDEIGVKQRPGCLGIMMGQREATTVYYVVSFRREQNQASSANAPAYPTEAVG